MSISLSADDRAIVVTTLRSAGCVFAEDEAELLISTAESPADLDAMLDRRVAGVPLEQVLGWAEFCGLHVVVGAGVFVPRRRTEFLARTAIGLVREPAAAGRTPVVVDMCCGVGALGAAIAAAVGVDLHATDIDPVAVADARRNIPPEHGQVYCGDLFAPLPASIRGRVDVLVANVPYVPTDEIELLPAEARLYEPRVALDGGHDGLDLARRIATVAPRWLRPGGSMLIEVTERQAAAALQALRIGGLTPRIVTDEDWSATVVIGTA